MVFVHFHNYTCDHMKALFNPQIKGFRYLFYTSNQDQESFSYLKSCVFCIYLLTMITAFLQFSFRQEELQILCPGQYSNYNCQIIPNFFGQLFYVNNFLILLLAFLIIFINHISKMQLKITSILSLFIQTLIMLIILTLIIVFLVDSTTFYGAYHDVASIILIFWLTIIEPVLFFNSLKLSLEIISEDYSFNGYNRNTWILLLIDFIIIIILGIFSAWMIDFYRNRSTYLLLSGVTVDYQNVQIFFVGVILVFLSVFVMFFYYYIKEKLTTTEKIKVQQGIIPYVFLFGILFLLIRGVSSIFTWDNIILRSISNIIDISFFIFILSIGIIGLINLQDKNGLEMKFRFTRPMSWLNGIPKYAKLLLLFFLGGMMFYYSLEQEAVSFLTDLPNYIASQKLSAVVGIVFFGYISVFLNFSPKEVPKNHVGPIKFFFSTIQGLFEKRT